MSTDINHPVLKAASALGVLATMDFWSAAGKVLAALYSAALLTEWIWKKLAKPLAINRGWMEGMPRDFLDTTRRGDL